MQATMNDWEAKQAARKFTASQLHLTHPYLVPGDSYVVAAKNIRIELKRAFPSIRFSVRSQSYSGGNSIRVEWTDGPAAKQVQAIADQYAGGTFDGMTDSYNYEHNAWTDAFGEAKYIFCNRHYSPRMIESVMGRVCRKLGGLDKIPSVEDYQQGRIFNLKTSGGCDVSREVNIALSKHTYCLTRVAA